MTKILSLDTSTEACSVALSIDGVISEKFQIAPRQHTDLVLPMVDTLLKEASIELKDLDAIAFGRGPGSFMGIRLAASVIQGLALGAELPVISISSLQALAQDAHDKSGEKNILAGWDARMGAIYWNVYRFPVEGDIEDKLNNPEDIKVGQPCVAAGNAWGVYQAKLSAELNKNIHKIIPDCYPRASCIARLALEKYNKKDFVSAENALPTYVRDDIAKKKKS